MKSCVVLLSGGLDSAVTLACATRDGFAPHCVSFDYGQRHRHELVSAGRVARALGATSHVTLVIDLRAVGGSALTSDAIDVPKDSESVGAIPVTYVPARNLTFLSLALGVAEVRGAGDLYIGVNAVDYSGYPDCRPAFIRSFESIANLATKAGSEGTKFVVRTPLMELSKAAIIQLGTKLGVDFSLTHSCYDPVVQRGEAKACGHCDSCVIRSRGFTEAGVNDPTRYV